MSKYIETEFFESVDGEPIRHERSLQVRKADEQDDFIKLYVRMIGAINQVPSTTNPLLNALLLRVTYASTGQKILLNNEEIKLIQKETGMKRATFYRQMRILVDYQVIIPTYQDKAHTKWRFDSTFYLNPYMFGYGKWDDIKNLRSYIEINEQGLSLLTETSQQSSLPSLTPGEQQRLFRIEGDYFGLKPVKAEAPKKPRLPEHVVNTVLEQVREADEAHRAESSSADQSEADFEFEILDDVSLKPKSFINGLGSTVVQAFGAEWKGKVLQFKNREQRDAFLRSRKK